MGLGCSLPHIVTTYVSYPGLFPDAHSSLGLSRPMVTPWHLIFPNKTSFWLFNALNWTILENKCYNSPLSKLYFFLKICPDTLLWKHPLNLSLVFPIPLLSCTRTPLWMPETAAIISRISKSMCIIRTRAETPKDRNHIHCSTRSMLYTNTSFKSRS